MTATRLADKVFLWESFEKELYALLGIGKCRPTSLVALIVNILNGK